MRTARIAFALFTAAAGANPASAAEPSSMDKQCLAIAGAGHGGAPGSTYKQLGPHQFRMRKLCAEWTALAASNAAGKTVAANALAGRCLKEVRFDLSRANEPAFERHVRAGTQMCRDQLAKTLKSR